MFSKKNNFFLKILSLYFLLKLSISGKAINTDYAKDRLVHIKTFGKR